MRKAQLSRATVVALFLAVLLPQQGALAEARKNSDPGLTDYRRPASVPVPKSNPMSPEKVALGQMLFFDPRLSGSGAISCATCHNPGLAWGDALPKGVGHMGATLRRRTPTILNVAFGEPFFWDGRADTLEDQAKGPLQSSAEMKMPAAAIDRIAAIPGYSSAFARAFPAQPVNLNTVAAAIAAYERTVVSGTAPFDKWVAGDESAVSESAKRGFVLYNGKANCAVCHMGWRMTDDGFHDIGLADHDDRGRAEIAPGIEQLNHAFKTPTLRNVNQRAPYMHDGSVPTLAAVIDHYDAGFVRRPSLDAEMRPLGLTAAEKADLLAFLDTLTSADAPVVLPALPQ